MVDILKYKDDLVEVLGDGDELRTLVATYQALTRQLPVTAPDSYSRLSELETYRAQLSMIIYALNKLRADVDKEYRRIYESDYTKYTGLNRPSQTAIESEIFSKRPEMVVLRNKLESYDRVITLVNSFVRCLDSLKSSVMECWRDARRLD